MGLLKTEEFYIKLKTSDADIKSICEKEKKYIDANYNTLDSRKSAFSSYRRGFAQYHLKNDIDKRGELYKSFYTLYKRKPATIKFNKSLLVLATKYKTTLTYLNDAFSVYSLVTQTLRLDREEAIERKLTYDLKVNHDASNLKEIKDYRGLLNKAKELLESESYIARILALSALTGRRVAEIACSGQFFPINEGQALFKGQLKTKNRVCRAYSIPLLCDYQLIARGIDRLRKEKPILINNPVVFHNNCSKALSQSVKKHFSSFVEGEITPKDLRAIYATIACSLHNTDQRKAHQSYYAEILGHAKEDMTTCNSYFDYYIPTDENNQLKGLK
jgi:hypothetical protein